VHRTHRALASLAIGLALVGATTALAAADPASRTQEQTDQGQALYQSELQRNLQLRKQADNEASAEHGQAAQRKALYQSELESNLATARAASAAAGTDPATFSPGVDRLATLLVGLVVGLLGGVAAMIGWTATTRRRPGGRHAPRPLARFAAGVPSRWG
jgi:hypothetical protein